MKKIYYNNISIATNSDGYEVDQEYFECEYSEEWLVDDADPIKDYVKNMVENACADFENEGYSWDNRSNYGSINFGTLTMDGAYHILFKNGEPVAVYYVAESDEE